MPYVRKIGEFHVLQKTWVTDFEASKLETIRSEVTTLVRILIIIPTKN